MNATQDLPNRVSVEFRGTGVGALRPGAIFLVLTAFVIPAAWGAAAFCRWLAGCLALSNGTQVAFEGRAKDVWGRFAAATVVGLLPQLSSATENLAERFWIMAGMGLAFLPLQAALGWSILRWGVSNVRLSCGTHLSFKGSYISYLGWMFLVAISALTVIGWAWSVMAMLRWLCRNIDGGDNRIVFLGSGPQYLWRALLATLTSLCVIPLPWIMVWLTKWIAQNLVIEKVRTPSDPDHPANDQATLMVGSTGPRLFLNGLRSHEKAAILGVLFLSAVCSFCYSHRFVHYVAGHITTDGVTVVLQPEDFIAMLREAAAKYPHVLPMYHSAKAEFTRRRVASQALRIFGTGLLLSAVALTCAECRAAWLRRRYRPG